MRSDVDLARNLLARHNPAPGDELRNAPLDERAERDLHELLTTDRAPAAPTTPQQRPLRRPVPLTAAAAVIALAVAMVAGPVGIPWIGTGGQAYAATPTPLLLPHGPGEPAGPVLDRMAEAAADEPRPDLSGRYNYIKYRAWYLNSGVTSEGTQSQLQPNVLEEWHAQNGSGRSIETDDDGRDIAISPARAASALPKPGTLSTSPRVLRHQLLGYPNHLGRDNPEVPNDVEFVRNLTQLVRTKGLVRPQLQAALWKALSTYELTSYGMVTDRAGRQGVAVAFTSDAGGLPTHYLLVIDPDDGRLLTYETVLTTKAGALNVRIPAVLTYEVYLNAGTVDSTHQRPRPR